MKYQVRFHLQKGENYMKWQVKSNKDKAVKYYSPCEYEFVLNNCTLINKISKAKKVYLDQVKDVSGWIECEEFFAIKSKNTQA